MRSCKKIADFLYCGVLLLLLARYGFWAVSFIGRYETTMDPLPVILWRQFLDGPALTLAVWGLLQGAFWAVNTTAKRFFWWGTLGLGSLFTVWYCVEVLTYSPPALPVSIDPHQIVVVLGATVLTGWALLCAILWGIFRMMK